MLPETLKQILETWRAQLHIAIPAQVVTYDSTTQTATVQPVIRGRRRDRQTDVLTSYVQQAINNVPVQWPCGGGATPTWAVTGPLVAGDTGLIVFSERSIAEWMSTGNTDNEPVDLRRNDIDDAVFIPGVRSARSPIPALAASATAVVVYGQTEVLLGDNTAVHPAAQGDTNDGNWTALANALATWAPVPNDGGAALKTLLTALALTGWPTTTAATKAKVV